ncbi:MAG: helix-turn-helix domain-containing protein [Treponema sp.]
MNFKDRLREEIEYKGLLVKEISSQVGISNSTFLSYIDSRAVLPNVETAVKIAQALGVTVEYLVTGSDTVLEAQYADLKEIIRDLTRLSRPQLETVKPMIHALVK